MSPIVAIALVANAGQVTSLALLRRTAARLSSAAYAADQQSRRMIPLIAGGVKAGESGRGLATWQSPLDSLASPPYNALWPLRVE